MAGGNGILGFASLSKVRARVHLRVIILMKNIVVCLLLPLVLLGCSKKVPSENAAALVTAPVTAADERFLPQLLAFSAAKEQQAHQLATELNLKMAPEVWRFFQAADQGDLLTVTNIFWQLRSRAGQYEGSTNDVTVASPVWQPVLEVELALNLFALGGTNYPLAYSQGIIQSIPAGSIYFGGTDSGRGLVTALCKSQIKGDPFFTLTQNALADARYLTYLRSMYGNQIHLPTTNDSQNAFTEFTQDLQRRVDHDRDFPNEPRQVKPGENYQMVDGKMQVSGQVAVMEINGLIVKNIFDQNPDREFYVEESFPLDWMDPYLEPHGLIFKLNRAPLPQLTTAMLDADRAFWAKQCATRLGDWLKPETSVSNVCAFVDAVYAAKDSSHFTGDAGFVTNEFATKSYSKLRSSLGGLYQWRLTSKTDTGDKVRLRVETDYAFKQAFALCPTSPEAIFRYVNFLLSQNRLDDAIRIARTARKLQPDNEQLTALLSQLLDYRQQQKMKATK
jgi:hypothetical protein